MADKKKPPASSRSLLEFALGHTPAPPPPPPVPLAVSHVQQPPPLALATGAESIGPPVVGVRYTPPTWAELLASKNPLMGLLEYAMGPARPPTVAAADPYGIQAWEMGAGPMPVFMGTTEPRGFFSRVEAAVSKVPAKGAHPNKVASILKSNASAEELTLRQVPEFLAGKGNTTVTPTELQAHLAQHPAPMPAVKTLGGSEVWSPELKNVLQGVPPSTQEGWTAAAERLERIAQRWQGNGDPAQANRYFTLSEEARSIAEGVNPATSSTAGMPKYAQYQLPGGESYRETLLTLPTTGKDVHGIPRDAPTPGWGDIGTRQTDRSDLFRGGHFDEPNILVHTRSNVRTLPTGERGRFVEEVQSDWHQQGKQKGYQQEGADYTAFYRTANGQQVPLGHGPTEEAARASIAPGWDTIPGVTIEVESRPAIRNAGGVPDAPFKESWPDLGLKQQLLEAAQDPEASWLGFTSGQTQAARYDLSKQISEVRYDPDTHFLEAFDLGGDSVIRREHVKPTDLPDLIGKEPAERLLQQEVLFDSADEANYHILSGQNLQVGGEGMRHFYDELLPKRLEKIVKPFGGKVERTTISGDPSAPADVVAQYANQPEHPFTKKQNTPAWIVRLTPEMKSRILKEGLPLMTIVGGVALSKVNQLHRQEQH